MNRTPITGIGLMCGTSLDALDVASVTFHHENEQWLYSTNSSHSYDLPSDLRYRILTAKDSSAFEFVRLDKDFAEFCAQAVDEFLTDQNHKIDFVASHGVTIFHQPKIGLSIQIGTGAILSSLLGIPVVCDFRSQDIAKGGQGAPLVPYADSLLFNEYDTLVNLGGFANISHLKREQLIGYDICPCNMALNEVFSNSNQSGKFDEDGKFARQGKLNEGLLVTLNQLEYYSQRYPKSLGSEWYETIFRPLIPYSNQDILNTLIEHISIQISMELPKSGRALFTGGGAHNKYLMERISAHANCICDLPDSQIIDYKEAIEFAFLGALRVLEKTNVSKSVTGAITDSIAGCIYLP